MVKEDTVDEDDDDDEEVEDDDFVVTAMTMMRMTSKVNAISISMMIKHFIAHHSE